ncbi:MFS transporter, partial [Methylosinus sp. R-45379]|uniref:MFS transporter n=1 Tax=Methylosinus sp. R-45379 TaxID=980563 RepID=UPI000B0BDCF1
MSLEQQSRSIGVITAHERWRWFRFAVLLTGVFLSPLDFFIVNIALPAIKEEFGATPSDLQLVVSGYMTTYAVFLITGGRLGDIFGRRKIFLSGLAGFAGASAICGLATCSSVLVVGRILQG